MIVRSVIATAALVAAAVFWEALPAPAATACNLAGNLTISARVAGSFSVTDAPDGSARLEAVILARGRPGWASASPSPGDYEHPPALPGGRTRLLAGVSAGRLMLVYERFAGIAWVGSRPVPMGTDNVVLVDHADSIPVIRGTMHVTPAFLPGGPRCAIADGAAVEALIMAALSSEPTVRAFMAP